MATQEGSNAGVSFGQNFAILNLDWMPLLINAIAEATEGKTLIDNYIRWNDAMHQKIRRPLTIFTSLTLNRGQPELERNKPFAKLIAPFGSCEEGSPNVGIDSRFALDEKDIVLQKTRWSATTSNNLEQILRAQHIDTVATVREIKCLVLMYTDLGLFLVRIETLRSCYGYRLSTVRSESQHLCHRR